MVDVIESSQQASGNWIASVRAVPGLQVYGLTEEEVVASASKLARILSSDRTDRTSTILGFYPGRIPEAALARR